MSNKYVRSLIPPQTLSHPLLEKKKKRSPQTQTDFKKPPHYRTHHLPNTHPKPTKTPALTTRPPQTKTTTTTRPANHTTSKAPPSKATTARDINQATALQGSSKGCTISKDPRRRAITMTGAGGVAAAALEEASVRVCWARWLVVAVSTFCSDRVGTFSMFGSLMRAEEGGLGGSMNRRCLQR